MAVTEADTLAAASVCSAMAEYRQLAGLIVGIEMALSQPAVAGEIMRMLEDVMDRHGDLSMYRELRKDAWDYMQEMRG